MKKFEAFLQLAKSKHGMDFKARLNAEEAFWQTITTTEDRLSVIEGAKKLRRDALWEAVSALDTLCIGAMEAGDIETAESVLSVLQRWAAGERNEEIEDVVQGLALTLATKKRNAE